MAVDPSPASESKQLVWLITGASSGLGMRLVRSVLRRGDRVIATARSIEKLKEAHKNIVFSSLDANAEGRGDVQDRLRLLALEVTSGINILKGIVDEAVGFWGHIDVLVNNAGAGYLGLIEEGGSEMARMQFNTNVFGVLDVTNAVLPHMRAAKSGTIVNVGSRSVWRSEIPSLGTYAASKAALHAFTVSLAAELSSLHIRVLLLSPGAFRTEGIYGIPFHTSNIIPDYNALRKICLDRIANIPGNEPGDPEKAVEVIADVVRGEGVAVGKTFPGTLLLGNDAESDLNMRWDKHQSVLEEWGEVTRSVWF